MEAETAAALHVGRAHERGLLWLLLRGPPRRGLGLPWQDINFKTREITFRRDYRDYKVTEGKSRTGDVKTG